MNQDVFDLNMDAAFDDVDFSQEDVSFDELAQLDELTQLSDALEMIRGATPEEIEKIMEFIDQLKGGLQVTAAEARRMGMDARASLRKNAIEK